MNLLQNSKSSTSTTSKLLDKVEQNIVIYQWRADQLFADAEFYIISRPFSQVNENKSLLEYSAKRAMFG